MDRKPHIAITQGDTNGIGYELIFKTFAQPEIYELCTPVVTGMPKTAAFQSKALGIQAPTTVINSVEDIRDNKLNIIACSNNDARVTFGQKSEESANAAKASVQMAQNLVKDGVAEAVVMAPQADAVTFDASAVPVYCNGNIRIVLATDILPKEVSCEQDIKESICNAVKTVHLSIKRDLRIYNPRIAIVVADNAESNPLSNIIAIAIDELTSDGKQTYGPYQTKSFLEDGLYHSFDVVIVIDAEGVKVAKYIADEPLSILYAGADIIITMPYANALEHAGENISDETALRNAIYLAIDASRNRREYDMAYGNPLPKLYHERRDESEKIRFSIPKSAEKNTIE